MQWEPDPSLNQTNSDITLLMLSQNGMLYSLPSDDPWMPAHRMINFTTGTVYVADYYVNLMGCIDQYQICNPNMPKNSGCSVLGGIEPVFFDITRSEPLGFNAIQLVTADRFLRTGPSRGMYFNVEGRGAAALNGE
jgi:hypothetical protein